uniref:Pituitary adenylate cyclase-activating polypeptide type I receptor-like isoform X4 n=1 Tax=Crassostrea virginica TaxID=6565 RepID=A0A8B8EKB4_CRAVI|nr:pituitary adenylate cyclase-activating polypeptide type I receptor-like isoform X4 [Crassostrea virginica]
MDVDRVYRVSKIQQTYRILEEQLKCNNTIHNSPPTKGLSCPPVFDFVMCWTSTEAGTTAVKLCPSYIDNFVKDGMVTRRCTENGTWFINPETLDTWTNFTDCIPDQSLSKAVQRHVDNLEKISTAGYSVSLMWECKLITAFNLYVLVASAFWLSVEAFVLIRLFHNWKYLQIRNAAWNHIAIGWGGPLLLVLPWAISKITNEDEWCWHSHPRTWVNWAFVRGPILFLIIVNEVLFIKILMFLWKRLRKPSSDPQFKSIILAMARHLCILIPLFGISDIVFVLMSFWYDVEYLYAEMLFNSLQGCMLSFTLCFAEKKALQEFRQVCFRGKRTRAMPLRRRNPNLTY